MQYLGMPSKVPLKTSLLVKTAVQPLTINAIPAKRPHPLLQQKTMTFQRSVPTIQPLTTLSSTMHSYIIRQGSKTLAGASICRYLAGQP